MPGPSSSTASATRVPRRSTRSRTVVPAGVWTRALPARARTICWIRSSSANAQASSSTSIRSVWLRGVGEGEEVLGDLPGDLGEPHLLALDPDPARIHPGEVEQVGGEVRQPVDLAPRRREELAAGALVEILVVEQLEEAGDREERRPQLVGGVRDELLAGAVELGELEPHPVERRGELADLVLVVVDHRLVEGALRDPVGGLLQAPEPPRVERRDREAEADGDQQRRHGGVEQPPLDERDRRELVGERAREEHHVAAREQRHRHLGVLAPVVPDAGAHRAHGRRGAQGRRIALHLGAADGGGVRQRQQRALLRRAADAEDDDARVRDEPGCRRRSPSARGCSAPPASAKLIARISASLCCWSSLASTSRRSSDGTMIT